MTLLDFEYTRDEIAKIEGLRSYIRVGRDVLSHRVRLGLTQEALGRAAGTKQSRISEIEALKGNPRFDTLDRIARALGLMIALVPAGFRCERCDHEWVPRDKDETPRVCPKCKSPYWDRPRKDAEPPKRPGSKRRT